MRIRSQRPGRYSEHQTEVPYTSSNGRCDLCLGRSSEWDWAIEAKAVRALRNNGSLEPNQFKQLLSPYPEHQGAVTDATKVLSFSASSYRAVLLWAFDYPKYPVEPLLDVYRFMLDQRVNVLEFAEASFDGLVHPHHKRGQVLAWSVAQR